MSPCLESPLPLFHWTLSSSCPLMFSSHSFSHGIDFRSGQFSRSVMFNSLWPHGLQHTRLPCSSPAPEACSNSCPSSWWCHPTISSSVITFPPPSIFSIIRVFSNESVLHIRWPKYWSFSFSISPSNEYSGLISFKIDRFDLLEVQGTLKSPLKLKAKELS